MTSSAAVHSLLRAQVQQPVEPAAARDGRGDPAPTGRARHHRRGHHGGRRPGRRACSTRRRTSRATSGSSGRSRPGRARPACPWRRPVRSR
nr:hypothetical protein [Angustibacter aerolatus]